MNSAIPAVPRLIAKRLLILLIVVMMGVCSCAHQPMIASAPATYLWQSGDQFVALVPTEQSPGSVPSDHPVSLGQDGLRGALASLEWQESADVKPVQLLTDYELSILAEQISVGLAKAAPGEELVFALIGNHPAFMGLAKRPQVTTGRVFYSQGRVNLILGMVHEELGKNDDRRLQPFVPGSREKSAGFAGQVTVLPEVGEKRRADWLLINPAAVLPLPKQLPSLGAVPTPAIDAVPVASPERGKPQQPGRTDKGKRIEERLLLLNGLKEKGLVTEEEYRAKRREILDDL
jgi:hypothetical protein